MTKEFVLQVLRTHFMATQMFESSMAEQTLAEEVFDIFFNLGILKEGFPKEPTGVEACNADEALGPKGSPS